MKILNNKFFLMLLILPFLKPPCFEFMPQLSFIDTLFDGMRIISFTIIFFLYILNKKISPIMACLIIYQGVIFLSTIFHHGDYWKFAVSCGNLIGFSMLVELGIKNNCKLFFKLLTGIYALLITVNFILIILFPHGISHDYTYGYDFHFLGISNSLPPVLIPVMGLVCINSAFYEKNITLSSKILIAIISVTILITWSATGVVGWFILLFYIIFIYRKKIASLFSAPLLYTIYAILFVLIVLFRVQSYFSFIIENILHKNITFTGRTLIWNIALALINKSPLIGYGVYEEHGMIFIRNTYYYAHNAVLEVILQGGIIALFFFILMYVFSAIILNRYKNHYISQIITATIFAILCMMMMETYLGSIWTHGLLIISGCVPDIIKQLEQKDIPCQKQEASFRTKYISYRLKGR